MSEKPISPLRQRMIEDMSLRNFVEKTRNNYIRHVRTFTAFLGRSPLVSRGARNAVTIGVMLYRDRRLRNTGMSHRAGELSHARFNSVVWNG
jgi:hypothetical protein